MKVSICVISTLLLWLGTMGVGFAQSPANAQTTSTLPTGEAQAKAREGTFQFISNTKMTKVYSTDVLERIESLRKEHEDYYWKMDEYTTVRILSRASITAPTFQPLTTLYVTGGAE